MHLRGRRGTRAQSVARTFPGPRLRGTRRVEGGASAAGVRSAPPAARASPGRRHVRQTDVPLSGRGAEPREPEAERARPFPLKLHLLPNLKSRQAQYVTVTLSGWLASMRHHRIQSRVSSVSLRGCAAVTHRDAWPWEPGRSRETPAQALPFPTLAPSSHANSSPPPPPSSSSSPWPS